MSTYTHKTRILPLMAALVIAVIGWNSSAKAQMAGLEEAKAEISIGSPDAPVTLHEFASLTCPHCANFHKNTLPQIKKEYVDTGKVRIVFNDFPLDSLAMGAAMIARCSGPDRSSDFNDMLFETQANWRDSNNPLASLIALARFYGLSGEDVNACLNNADLLKFVENKRNTASAMYKIKSTPSFILNGELIEGAQPFDAFKTALDKALAAQQ